MRPSVWQQILAMGWLPACWQWGWSIAAVVFAIWKMELRLGGLAEFSTWLLYLFAVVAAFLTGWFASIIPALFVFGPILYTQGMVNGGPFAPGDKVYIIAGKHRGTISVVYKAWQNETVRVELGAAARESYTDIFAAYQLIRVTDDARNAFNPEMREPDPGN